MKRLLSLRRAAMLIVVLLPLIWTGHAMAATRTVTNLNDSGVGSLRHAIAIAVVGDAVDFSVTGTITLTSGSLVVNKPLTITGPGAANLSVSGNNASRVFTIVTTGGTVNLSGLTITRGSALMGGGISNSGTNLNLTDCVITGNSVTRNGGGIFSNRYNGPQGDVFSNLQMVRCTVTNNHSTTNVGNYAGGGIQVDDGSFSISDSTISDNTALNGGGITAAAATSTLNNCVLNNNSTIAPGPMASDNNGGAIFVRGSGTMNINNCSFDSNSSARGGGGAIFNHATLNINGSTFRRSLAAAGGAIYSANDYRNAVLTMIDSTVSGNSAESVAGGLIVTGTTRIYSSTIHLNGARESAGLRVQGSVLLRSTIVAGNLGGNIGGGPLEPASAFNFIGGDPRLGPLQNNGGPTLTHAPLTGSPVIDAGTRGSGATLVTTDQRGLARPADFPSIPNASDGADIGAVELYGPGGIQGRIINSQRVGVAGVIVLLVGWNVTAITDSNGNYEFTNLAPANYFLRPMLNGYYFAPAGRNVYVGGGVTMNQNFTAGRYASIYGRISDNRGVALENVTVTPSGSTAPMRTNSAGYFTLPDLPEGTYTLTPSLSGYFFTPSTRTVILRGTNVGSQNFIGATGYNVYGRIATSNGTALEGIQVTLSGSQTATAVTNNAGYYTLRNIANGTYTITPNSSGRTFTPATRSVTVNNGDTAGHNFTGTEP